jgi:uncharacterized membrane protein YcaP (DUF421 family)
MESILRGAATYLFVCLIFRIAGKRTLAQITTFDAVLLLIISETTQAALVDNDNSMTNSFLLIMTMLGMDVLMSSLKQRFRGFEQIVDGVPLVIVDRGKLQEVEMTKERVDKEDILHSARENHGIGSFDEIDYAVLEQSGGITIIPKQ